MSRNAAAKRFGVRIASAVRWVARFKTKGEISPAATGEIVVPVVSRPIATICSASFAGGRT